MACVDDLQIAGDGRLAEDQRGVLRGQRALAEEPVGARHEFGGAQADRDERAEDGAQVRRQHRRSHAFAGDIGHHEMQVAIVAGDEIAIVATDHTGRLVVIRDIPSGKGNVARRQQAFLNLRGQLKVVLERALLFGREAIQTNAGERILAQPFVFHRALADLADAKCAVIDAVQSAVDFVQQREQALTLVLAYYLAKPRASGQ